MALRPGKSPARGPEPVRPLERMSLRPNERTPAATDPQRVLAALALAAALAACGGRRGAMTPAVEGRPYLLETAGEYAISRLYADGFEELTPRERVLAFYLSRAALAGRDIYYDQMGRDGLEIRDLLEEILTTPRTVPLPTLQAVHAYLKLFWLNSGNHLERTKRKFLPTFTFQELRAAARAALDDGARIRLALGETLDQKLARLRPALFDPAYETLLTCKTPPRGQDILACSSVNYYDGVTLDRLERYRETHPLNSRLVLRGGRLQEEIYRAGRGDLPPGRYARELRALIGFLEKARPQAEPQQAAVLGLLVDYFTTGDSDAFRRYNIAWVGNETAVDTVDGFIESYKDPRGQKGAFEGLVYFVDRRREKAQKALAGLAQYFEDRAPWADVYKRKGFTAPAASAVTVLFGTGESGPSPAIGVNLPNEEAIRERYGNKSVSLVNVMEAGDRSLGARLIGEFALPEDRALLLRHGAEAEMMQTTMHEALGHASGKVRDGLQGDPSTTLREHYAALEEARAELVALHCFFDPKLVEIGAISSSEVAVAAYRDFVINDLAMLRRVREGEILDDDHMRATHLVVSYLREVTGAVEEVRLEGRTYLRVKNLEGMRGGVARLLAEVQRIKGEGDYPAARALMERFGIRIDPGLRDEIVGRAAQSGLPSDVAFVMPDLVPLRDSAGIVRDVQVAYRSDFTTQMLQYSGKLPLEE
jgi:dipeptidyl-peptidase III